jgi:hypothetical protein
MERFPRDSKEYYVEVHQHLAPLARQLERELDQAKAELSRRASPPSPSTAPTVEVDELPESTIEQIGRKHGCYLAADGEWVFSPLEFIRAGQEIARAALAAKPATQEAASSEPAQQEMIVFGGWRMGRTYLAQLERSARRYDALVGAAHAHCTGAEKTSEQQAVHDAVKHLGEKHGIELLGAAIDAALLSTQKDQQ